MYNEMLKFERQRKICDVSDFKQQRFFQIWYSLFILVSELFVGFTIYNFGLEVDSRNIGFNVPCLKHNSKISMFFMQKERKKFECWGFQSGIPYSGDYNFIINHNGMELGWKTKVERRESEVL